MSPEVIDRLKARVAHAYYNFGRFIATHPYICISFGLLTVLVLSAPIVKLKLPSAAPLDVHWSEQPVLSTHASVRESAQLPSWLLNRQPNLYVQQFVVRAIVQSSAEQFAELTSKQVVKAALSRSFNLTDIVRSHESSYKCSYMASAPSDEWLPRKCILLAPTLFWPNLTSFQEHIFGGKPCAQDVCVRDLLLGVPQGYSGIRKSYSTKRPSRSIQFVVTLFLEHYDAEVIRQLGDSIKSSRVFSLETPDNGQQHWAYVFYRPQKHASREYLPLGFSYFVLLMYVYLCASKIEMVKYKLGLTFALFVTVASSLLTAAGICALFNLTPTLWGMELFPYLVTLVGLENTLCITRSVVWTPANLDVKSRLARGLSREGWSITKYFFAELTVIILGFFTFIQEIQEFCAFAVVGLVVDFYMQMFFYAPCLSMDLLRLDQDTRVRHQLRQLQGEPCEMTDYPELECPFKKWLPTYFFDQMKASQPSRLQRFRSESNIDEVNNHVPTHSHKPKGHRRTASDITVNVDTPALLHNLPVPATASRRLKLLYFWTRTRFFQRFLLLIAVIWIVWFAAIVHQWRLITNISPYFSTSSTSVDSVLHTDWDWWQRRTFRMWPSLFDYYNRSLSGSILAMLPPIVMNVTIAHDDHILLSTTEKYGKSSASMPNRPNEFSSIPSSPSSSISSELSGRVWWLELQITLVLVISVAIFAIVAAFFCYVFYAVREKKQEESQDTLVVKASSSPFKPSKRSTHQRVGSHAMVDVLPIVMSAHDVDVEHACVCNNSQYVISTCLTGETLVWNARTGEACSRLPRERVLALSSAHGSPVMTGVRQRHTDSTPISDITTEPALRQPSPVWCMYAADTLLLLGCADGSVELWDVLGRYLISIYRNPSNQDGVIHVLMRSNKFVIVRLQGAMELIQLNVIESTPSESTGTSDTRGRRIECRLIRAQRAHQRAVTCLHATNDHIITASRDHTLKLFSLRHANPLHTMYAHNAPVTSVMPDTEQMAIYSSCEHGVVCCWGLQDGRLLRTLEHAAGEGALVISFNSLHIVGFTARKQQLWLWGRTTGQLVTRIQRDLKCPAMSEVMSLFDVQRSLVLFGDHLAATVCHNHIQLWDMRYKVALREVSIDKQHSLSHINGLLRLDSLSLICYKDANLYKICFPMIKID